MQTNELVRQVKERVEGLAAAEQKGIEELVLAHLQGLRELLKAQPGLDAEDDTVIEETLNPDGG